MSSTVALLQSALPSVEYYAPNYKIEVEGRELDPQAKGDVLEVKVTMHIYNLTSIDLTINTCDDKSFRYKYSDSQTFRYAGVQADQPTTEPIYLEEGSSWADAAYKSGSPEEKERLLFSGSA